MSAICGIYHRDGAPATRDELSVMVGPLAYRGAAGRDLWLDGPAGGATLHSSTADAGPPARAGAARPALLAADARLDNRGELSAALQLDRAAAPGDAALILAAYERWGEGAPQHLLGDFAFVIWDGARQRFFGARDHFGVKQLYYYCSARLFACATEIPALLAIAAIPALLNEVRLGDMLSLHLDDVQSTLYANILRLPAASSISISAYRSELRRYWSLDPQREIRQRDDAAYAEEYRALLGQAVAARLRTTQRIGAALSGGLDSSAIVALASAQLAAQGRPALDTISAIYEAVPACDERRYIAPVVARSKVLPHYVVADALGPLFDLASEPQREDEPLWSPQAPVSWLVYEQARRQGIGVFLEGMFGDDAVGTGLGYLGELLRGGHWLRLVHEANARARLFGGRPSRIVAGQVAQLAPSGLRGFLRHGRQRGPATPLFGAPLRAEFVRRLSLAERWSSPGDSGWPRGSSAREVQWRVLGRGAWQSIAPAFLDRQAARSGVELRHPFLDRRLVEFCLALPPEQKLRDGWPRWIARAALGGILPEEVRWRTVKSNLTAAFSYGLRHHDRALVEDILIHNPGPIAAYIDLQAVQAIYHRFLAQPDAANSSAVWVSASLGIWLRRSRLGGAAGS